MSTQGTGSINSLWFDRQLLDSWGVWASSGDLGMGYNPVTILPGRGDGCMFSYTILGNADAVICSLPVYHKNIVLKYFLHRDRRKISDKQVSAAISVFSELFHENPDNLKD